MIESTSAKPNLYDRWLLVFAGLGSLLTLAIASWLGFSALLQPPGGEPIYRLMAKWQALAFLALALFGVPGLVLAGRRFLGRPPVPPAPPSPAWLFAWPALIIGLGLGYLGLSRQSLPEEFGLIGNLLAGLAPMMLVIYALLRRGPWLSPRRVWGQLLLGIWGAPILSLMIEGLLVIPFGIIIYLGLSASGEGQALISQVLSLPEITPTAISEVLRGFASNPYVIFAGMFFGALLVPLVEEAAKTVVIWPLLRRKISPAEAFLGGALGGVGYGFFEMLLLSQPGTNWLTLVVGRSGATLMHAFATALTACGLAISIQRRRWWPGLLAYACAVLLHSIWNIASLGFGVVILAGDQVLPQLDPHRVGNFVGLLIGGLSLLAFLGLPAGLRIIQATAKKAAEVGEEAAIEKGPGGGEQAESKGD